MAVSKKKILKYSKYSPSRSDYLLWNCGYDPYLKWKHRPEGVPLATKMGVGDRYLFNKTINKHWNAIVREDAGRNELWEAHIANKLYIKEFYPKYGHCLERELAEAKKE